MRYLFILLLFFAVSTNAIDYEIDVNSNNVEYVWIGSGSDSAKFNREMYGVGVTALFNDNLGLRLGYMKGGEATTTGRYAGYIVDMRSITSFELIYKERLWDNISVFCGIGSYLIPVPIRSEEENYFRADRDDDEGYFYGLSFRLYNNISINYRFTKYSTIKDKNLDEWIKGNSIQLTYKF